MLFRSEQQQSQPQARETAKPAESGNGERRRGGYSDRQRDGRRDDGRRDDGQRRWTRPPREALDAPLPEDVAFRPAAEGGDPSILPAHRRPAPGARRPGRVFYAGTSAQYVTRDDLVTTPADEDQPLEQPDDVPISDDAGDESSEVPKRRRRGRRGGRGRRRGGETSASEDGTAEAEDAETGDDESEDDDEPAEDIADDWDDDDIDTLPDADEGDEPDESDAAPAAEARPAPTLSRLDPSELPQAFRDLGLDDEVLQTVARSGFTSPTPIQMQSIPVLLTGRDVVGIAQTGTGKTLAFGLPMLQRLNPARSAVQGLVLVPTRELASQVLDVLRDRKSTRLNSSH